MELNEKLFEILDFRDGFYIECGANDGYSQSNTILLEKNKNWSGLLIEPSNNSMEICKNSRSEKNIFENCVLSSFENQGKVVFGDFDGHLMSSVNGTRLSRNATYEKKYETLNNLLIKHKITKVDFFSLDVEGHELEVLKGMDFEYCSPTWIIIEIYKKDYEEIINLMFEKKYKLICNLSNYNHETNPGWDGTHNDYLFKKNITF